MAKRLKKKERLIKKLKSVLIFLAIFNLLAIPLYFALYNDFSFRPLQELNANLVAGTLKTIGYNAYADGISVVLQSDGITRNIDISWDSSGWKSMYAVASLILATPVSRLARKMGFAAAAVGIIFLVNYLRILTTIWISAKFGFDLFDVIHTILWREGLIMVVVAVWLGWVAMEKYNIGKIK